MIDYAASGKPTCRILFGVNMNVRISYTVDLEEIPEKVNYILNECNKELSELSKKLKIHVERTNCVSAIESIEDIRKKMLRVDNKLGDCYSILVGYNRAIAESKMPAKESEPNNGDN